MLRRVGGATAALFAGGAASTLSTGTAAAQTASSVYLPVGPIRVYDSRDPFTFGRIFQGEVRTLGTGAGADEFAQCFNLTVTATAGSGYLAVFPGDETYQGTSSINWSGPNQTIANNAYTKIGLSDGSINVYCGSGNTHFVIDLVASLTVITTALRLDEPPSTDELLKRYRLRELPGSQ
ncbi:MAG: hypothetical protein ACOYML_01845 [Microthrixaceae bacterium]